MDGAAAETVPHPMAVAPMLPTLSPAGSTSSKATPVRLVLAFGFPMSNLISTIPPGRTWFGVQDLVRVGATATMTDADAVPPVPPLVELMLPVVLLLVPADVPVTLTAKLQLPDAAKPRPEIPIMPLPAVAVSDAAVVTAPACARHVPVAPFGVATTRPDGRESLNAMPVSASPVFGFDTVKVNDVDPFNPTVAAPNALVSAGGAST